MDYTIIDRFLMHECDLSSLKCQRKSRKMMEKKRNSNRKCIGFKLLNLKEFCDGEKCLFFLRSRNVWTYITFIILLHLNMLWLVAILARSLIKEIFYLNESV